MYNIKHRKNKKLCTSYLLRIITVFFLCLPAESYLHADPPLLMITSRNITNDQLHQTNGEAYVNFGVITRPDNNMTNYYPADQYLQITYQHIDPYLEGWGMQIYTDNENFLGTGKHGGLIDTSFHNRIPLLWQVYNSNQKTNVKMGLPEKWAIVNDKNDNDWAEHAKQAAVIFSNQLTLFPPDRDRTLPDDILHATNIFLYLGAALSADTSSSSWGLEYGTTLFIDLYYLIPAPAVIAICPDHGRTGKKIDVAIQGFNFIQGPDHTRIRLQRSGEEDVIPVKINVTNDTLIYCTFDLKKVKTGYWDVVAVNSNTEGCLIGKLTDGFLVEKCHNLIVRSIDPDEGNNSTVIHNIFIKGQGFAKGAGVKLQRKNKIIPGFNVKVLDTETIRCSFNLSRAGSLGYWDLTVINRDHEKATLKKAFLIKGYHMAGDIFIPVNNVFNPHNGEKVYFKWSMTRRGTVTIKVYNLINKILVNTLIQDKFYEPGYYQVDWDGCNKNNTILGSEVYLVQISVRDEANQEFLNKVEKIILVK